ncbi:endonuclease/exonuclease/phosphatase family protein [Candidatus Sumerlaeota bacterium]|nr:endonuclease/exonuclease/phosphatase family protein [Candidatus Sumerlaeota bacterium]
MSGHLAAPIANRWSLIAAPLSFCLVLATAGALLGAQPAAGGELTIRAMTYNLKNPSGRTENTWADRRPIMKNLLLAEDPDLLGTQEGYYFQVREIAADLGEYDWIGEGRGGGSSGELMAIFYKRDRFDPIQYGHFWLSDTPNVIASRSWGNSNIRMVTWVRFRERESGVEFYHFNTHFDHQVQFSREQSAKLMIRRIRERRPVLPVIVTGDFNASQTNVVHEIMLSSGEGGFGLFDSWDLAARREGEGISTGHGWGDPQSTNRRIDWVLISKEFESLSSRVNLYKENGQWPSDHFPVMSVLKLTFPSP